MQINKTFITKQFDRDIDLADVLAFSLLNKNTNEITLLTNFESTYLQNFELTPYRFFVEYVESDNSNLYKDFSNAPFVSPWMVKNDTIGDIMDQLNPNIEILKIYCIKDKTQLRKDFQEFCFYTPNSPENIDYNFIKENSTTITLEGVDKVVTING